MTDSQVAVAIQSVDERRAQAVSVLEQLLRAMDVPATLETRDLPDGSISIAVTPGVELAGIVPGRRSPLGDALQYLVNKLVNKPGQERRWVAVGIGAHPEPRGPKPAARPLATPAPESSNTSGRFADSSSAARRYGSGAGLCRAVSRAPAPAPVFKLLPVK